MQQQLLNNNSLLSYSDCLKTPAFAGVFLVIVQLFKQAPPPSVQALQPVYMYHLKAHQNNPFQHVL